MNAVLQMIKSEFPDKAIDISESLQLLQEVIKNTMEDISNKVNTAFHNRDFDSVNKYQELAKSIHLYEKKIEEIIDFIDIEIASIEEEIDEDTEKKLIPSYSDYLVDHNIEHTLYENLTHKRPFAFSINDSKMLEVKTWQEMFIRTCDYLIAVDEHKFLSFENNPKMNGKKNKYFSTNPGSMNNPKSILNKIYVETKLSANSLRNLIVKLLKEYNFKISDYKIYFRADYTELNK
ncbi:MAG: hypothetical protein ACOX2A_06825 [Tepidanaerobacteraceae bacterium]